jgi:hypothetical protein
MLKMKRTLGILLALCFVMSVTAAAVSAAPNFNNKNGYNNHNDGKNIYNNHGGQNNYGNHYGQNNYGNHYGQNKGKHFKQGYWGYKHTRHNKDRYHKSFWYSNDKYWFHGYWY